MAGKRETGGAASPVRRVPPAASRAAAPAGVFPAAAAEDPKLALARTPRIEDIPLTVVVLGVPVGAPLLNVAVHVVQPEGVGLVTAHLARTPQALHLLPSAIGVSRIEVGVPNGEFVTVMGGGAG